MCFAVDEVKPKRDTRLARLDDITREPRVGLIVDHYDADWSPLWWVRIDATRWRTRPVSCGSAPLDALVTTYPPYPRRGPGRTGRGDHAAPLERWSSAGPGDCGESRNQRVVCR